MRIVPTERTARVSGTAFLLFCLALFITAYSARNPRSTATASAFVAEVQRPIGYLTKSISGSISDVWTHYVALVDLQKEHEALLERTRALEQDKSRLLELEQENERLRKLLNAVPKESTKAIAARVVGYDASNWAQVISVDRGIGDGITTGMPVITAEGIVGQITAVGLHTSRALLITDHSSGVDAVIQGSRARGIVEGIDRKRLRWRFVLDSEEVKIGDRLVTSGLDGVFPPGLFVGRVSEVEKEDNGMFLHIEVTPAAPFSKLEEVLILNKSAAAEEQIPPSPVPPKVGGKKM